ncbi:MAG: hypothetical protein B7Z54_04040 [Sphingobacteriales bacterium 12-47-4]|nr:MAG: hypothetical protein B7Z54_04040 [Sphingobacteriales bacterium 12-47-4]
MNKYQWITAGSAVALIILIFAFRDETPPAKKQVEGQTALPSSLTIDSLLVHARESLSPGQLDRILFLEKSVGRGDVSEQKLHIYHQLARFWQDTGRNFVVSTWYRAEAARLENSEKNLTFAAHLLLDSLREEPNVQLRRWEAQQAKELFERALKINPDNDSSRIGLGTVYLFGDIADNPMQGIQMIREVIGRDSTNVYGQMMLGYGSALSGQYDKAADRFDKVLAIDRTNMEAVLMLVRIGEAYEKEGKKTEAITQYEKALPLLREDWKPELKNRIDQLKN